MQWLLRIVPRVDVRSSEPPRFLRTEVINEPARRRHRFLGNGTDCTAKGPLSMTDRSKNICCDWASLTKGTIMMRVAQMMLSSLSSILRYMPTILAPKRVAGKKRVLRVLFMLYIVRLMYRWWWLVLSIPKTVIYINAALRVMAL